MGWGPGMGTQGSSQVPGRRGRRERLCGSLNNCLRKRLAGRLLGADCCPRAPQILYRLLAARGVVERSELWVLEKKFFFPEKLRMRPWGGSGQQRREVRGLSVRDDPHPFLNFIFFVPLDYPKSCLVSTRAPACPLVPSFWRARPVRTKTRRTSGSRPFIAWVTEAGFCPGFS